MRLLDDFIAAIVTLLLLCGVARAQFVNEPQAAALRAMIPVAEYRDDPQVLIYTQQTMPRCYQMPADHPFRGPHSVFLNISGETPETNLPHGHGGNWGVDFPWRRPGGIDRSPNTKHFSFVKFAGGPCVWWHDGTAYRWIFPEDTIFGEVLTVGGPGGDYAFECRVKERRLDGWSSRVFRPFTSPEALAAAVELLEPGSPLVAQIQRPTIVGYRSLVDSHHHAPTLRSKAAEFVLPDLSPDLVRKLLTQFDFDEATGTSFEGDCFAPTSRQAFSIVPANYDGTHLGTSDESCRQCHQVAGFDGDLVDFRKPKQKYGHIPGNDEILSFHPFAAHSISRNGFPPATVIPTIPGIVEQYDAARHTSDRYRRIK